MKKTELTKKQQKDFSWLMEADTENEDVEVSKIGNLIWKAGLWEDGTWKVGIWKAGLWEDGTWEGGTWEAGTWEAGKMWSNLKQKYVEVKFNKRKGEFEVIR